MASQKYKQYSVLASSTLAFTVCFMVWMMLAVVGIPVKEQLGLSETEFGILAATPVLSGSLVRVPLGIWTDRYGGRIVFFVLMLLCVPAIFFSIMGLLINLNAALAVVLTLAVVLFYWRLSAALAVAMVLFMVVCWALVWLLPPGYALYWAIFVLAWIGQFYGHKIEGKKPSFFKDLQFLLIGPIWCMDAYLGKILPPWKTRRKNSIMSV